MTMKDDDEYPKTVATWKCKEGDPNGKPMSIEEFVQLQRAEHEEMLKSLFEQIQAYFELGASGGKRH